MDIKSRRGVHDNDVRVSISPTFKTTNLSSRSPRPAKSPVKTNASDSDSESESELEEERTNENTSVQQSDPSPPTTPIQESPRPRKSVQNKVQLESYSSSTVSSNPPQSSTNLKWIPYAFLLILPALAYSNIFMQKSGPKTCKFEKLRNQSPLQSSEIWDALTINIELLLNGKSKSPNIYLLLHSNKNNGKKMQKLIKDIALETSKCFDGQRPIEMRLEDFEEKDGDDYGFPIEQYKKKLKEGNVFLIVNLNDIPPNAARSLHTICDTYSPIAPDVVIFLSLQTHLSTSSKSPSDIAYQTLRELWQKVPDNELDALITRVIDQVLLLQG